MPVKISMLFFEAFLILLLVLFAGCTGEFLPGQTDRYPHVGSDSATWQYEYITHSFNFENRVISLTVPVDMGIYDAAYNSDKSAYLNQEKLSLNEWSGEYYRSFMNSPAIDTVYAPVLEEFGKIRQEMSLDSDRYAELIFAYAQSVPYRTDNVRTQPKFPIETIYENSGDCDDKSILAAALLAREGYDVALFEFEAEEHMAVGIKSDACTYKNTGYAYAETTDYSLIGWPEIKTDDDSEIISDPYVILAGSGTITYQSCGDVLFIYEKMNEALKFTEDTEKQISEDTAEAERMSDEIRAFKDKMNSLKESGNIAEYNRNVSEYNSMASEYNKKSSSLKELVKQYNKYVNIYNYITEHRYDRKGVYEYLAES